ncbi:GNAT family N-acetyltransferase [Hungatella effluvii]|uniref:GNAT family N-acetyltransferase n=1 Tax=Hungatella effluvii TaxID=1096246 RepID=UPI002A83619E|nr:GNAT family N-acetyltransferase [Hungatella effluvii]
MPKGCFHSFPYLHLIAVKEEYRGQGIGRKLIDYLENVVCADAHRLFLFNRKVHPVK